MIIELKIRKPANKKKIKLYISYVRFMFYKSLKKNINGDVTHYLVHNKKKKSFFLNFNFLKRV